MMKRPKGLGRGLDVLLGEDRRTGRDPADDRQAAFQDFRRDAGPIFVQHRCRSARQDDPLGLHPLERGFGLREGGDFGIDPRLAHAARDQLRHLGTEIDDQDRFGDGRIARCGA